MTIPQIGSRFYINGKSLVVKGAKELWVKYGENRVWLHRPKAKVWQSEGKLFSWIELTFQNLEVWY